MVPGAVDEHLRSAIQTKLDDLVAPLVRHEVVAALATNSDASQTGTALKEAISSALFDRLATTFLTETGEDAHATRPFTATVPTCTIAHLIGAAFGSGNLAPHPECKTIYLPTFDGITGQPTENGPPALADTVAPRGTEIGLGRLVTEKRHPYRSTKRGAPGAHETDSDESTESRADAED